MKIRLAFPGKMLYPHYGGHCSNQFCSWKKFVFEEEAGKTTSLHGPCVGGKDGNATRHVEFVQCFKIQQ